MSSISKNETEIQFLSLLGNYFSFFKLDNKNFHNLEKIRYVDPMYYDKFLHEYDNPFENFEPILSNVIYILPLFFYGRIIFFIVYLIEEDGVYGPIIHLFDCLITFDEKYDVPISYIKSFIEKNGFIKKNFRTETVFHFKQI